MTAVDRARTSFVDVAPDSHFPIQNLPYGVFSRRSDRRLRCGVAIGNVVLDLAVLEEVGVGAAAGGDDGAGASAGQRDALR